jgi:putative aldouronate transport system permease protein
MYIFYQNAAEGLPKGKFVDEQVMEIGGDMKAGKKKKSLIKQFELQAMTLPGIIFLLIFSYVPMYGLILAFKNYTVLDTMATAAWAGLENFKWAMDDEQFWSATINTIWISVIKVIIGFPVPLILAIMIYTLKDGRYKKISQTISYLPHFISWIILGGMLVSWLGTNGLFNTVLIGLGMIDEPISFLLEGKYYYWIAAFSDIWKEAGWGTILYLAGMAGIDPSIYEAASIDGAGGLQKIRYITIPGIKGIIALNFIMTMSGLLDSNFDQSMVLQNALNIGKSEVLNTYVYKMGVSQGNFSYATAVGLMLSVVSLVLLLISNAATKRINDRSIL